ncbi:RNase adapter RapZ [Ignatzschineria sp. RMDPL8A]|uniref:RNase adapter RapZ n=1 Tax=Ignatzschineria sp. RMDPL8A TaxID=2999236 RepID=UPI002446767C|nr:RNase adapter RapZ [Ignatzschineria sp. RMDPL8A]MDG9730131.1 RNase adapter RapZ [Ignatzschineria sp. RMDPL8A]
MIQLLIVSGLSGSGKSIALQTLEDEGFYCVDNLPLSFLELFLDKITENHNMRKLAIGLDARGFPEDLEGSDDILNRIRDNPNFAVKLLFLQASNEVLLKRYGATRRKHPLANKRQALLDAILYERTFLEPILKRADVILDTSFLNVHELRSTLISQLLNQRNRLIIQIQSFGFKNGPPLDADFMFDARCLTNPHWNRELRDFTGLDEPVIEFFNTKADILDYYQDIRQFFFKWIPTIEKGTRAYLSIAIGCTGGQHRSVYLAKRLHDELSEHDYLVTLKHRELSR